MLLISICIATVLSHSTKYQINRNETCYSPTPAKIYSWHFHVLYWQINEEHTKGTYELRDLFMETFKHRLGPECTSNYHQDKMCMFKPSKQPNGPFLTAQWSIFFLNEDFTEIVPWIMQHRGKYDVLVHPNSGCDLEDHSWWAFWGGNPWPINLDAFDRDEPFASDSERKTTNELINSPETSDLIKQFLMENEQ